MENNIQHESFKENDDYIYRLINKVNTIDDRELTELVQRLINERNSLSQIANIDTLTGLNNRRVLSEIQGVTGILMLDIDNFKDINDTFGHDVGDYVIKSVANIIKGNTRSSDYVCRYGGDEFLVAFIDCPKDIIKARAEKICEYIANNLKMQNNSVTVSIGIAINNKASEQIDDIIKQADMALYQSKNNGKSQVSEYTSEEDTQHIHR